MIGQPKIEERNEQPYVGIRSQVPISEMPNTIPQSLDALFGWLGQKGINPAGPPFIRYHVINMEALMDIELGVPVATPIPGDGRINPGLLPAGRYASLIYTGIGPDGIKANAALLDWGAQQGLVWDNWQVPEGDAFAGRVEFLLSGPQDDPDPANWESEVAIRLADGA